MAVFFRVRRIVLVAKEYVSFDKTNFKTFSIEYLKLLEAVCSVIDVIGRVIAYKIGSCFNI